ncbi:uncharacterized protein LOC123560426 isoform X2 [Mercenaria mercenaria]|uniref:uncharacterized protein LOC123560426 isoform X2 n=1 Tax=Mercenaria mercenaria TaxID=6596 RepID=UPI00234EDA8C|nr:uncharacterized protein LOC123560426 isoform X2 [Mercenaria mercenaria]
MARPKEKTSTAFDQKCLAAAKKLASFQASKLKEDIERLYTDELLADLSVDLCNRTFFLHRCILKARNEDLYNYIVSIERNDTSGVSIVTNSHSTDIENCLRSLYRDDDVSATVEKLDKYFHPEANSELEHVGTENTNESDTRVINSGHETVTGDDLHVISENITNTSLDLVKNEVGCLNRDICSCISSDVEYLSSCDKATCDKNDNGSKQDSSVDNDLTGGNESVRNLCGCGKSRKGNVEGDVYILAERIVEQVIIEAQNIVANVNVDNIAKRFEGAKDSESVIKCDSDAKFQNSIDADTDEGQKLEGCSITSNKLKHSVEKQMDQNGNSTFCTTRKSSETIQRLLERVYGIKLLKKPSISQLVEPCSELGEDLLRMLLEHDLTDCTIEVQGEIFPAHRCVLAARSSYFAAMLGGSWRESGEEKIVLEGVLPSVLKQTLLYLYGGVIQVDSQCPLGGLIMMADMYGMEGLKEVVAYNLNVDFCHFFHRPCPECIAGVPEALALTMMYNMDAMKEKCVRWINKNFWKVWPAKSLATLPQEVLEFTVSSAIKDLALNNVLDILIDCQRLNEKTPHLKWTEPVFDMITQLMDAAIEFASQNFINLISGNTFSNIDKKGINFNRQPLEDIFGMIIQALSPENSCLAYLSLHRWIKSAETAAEDKIPEYSEEFVEFVNALFKKCKEHLCLYIHQVANTANWELLSKDMQQSVMQDANYVCIDTNRGRMARPKLTSMQKISEVVNSDILFGLKFLQHRLCH